MNIIQRIQLFLISIVIGSGVIADIYYLVKYHKLLIYTALHNEVMTITLQGYIVHNCLGIWVCCLFWLGLLQVLHYLDYI